MYRPTLIVTPHVNMAGYRSHHCIFLEQYGCNIDELHYGFNVDDFGAFHAHRLFVPTLIVTPHVNMAGYRSHHCIFLEQYGCNIDELHYGFNVDDFGAFHAHRLFVHISIFHKLSVSQKEIFKPPPPPSHPPPRTL